MTEKRNCLDIKKLFFLISQTFFQIPVIIYKIVDIYGYLGLFWRLNITRIMTCAWKKLKNKYNAYVIDFFMTDKNRYYSYLYIFQLNDSGVPLFVNWSVEICSVYKTLNIKIAFFSFIILQYKKIYKNLPWKWFIAEKTSWWVHVVSFVLSRIS